VINCLIVGVFLAVALLARVDPVVTLFAPFSALGTAAFMAILFLTSVSIVVFFARNDDEHSLWVTVVAPLASILVFGYVGYLTWDNPPCCTRSLRPERRGRHGAEGLR
jgi:hypothetical protein